MTISEMTKLLAETKRALKSLVRAAGDDMGCDGTDVEARELRMAIAFLEADIRAARFDRLAKKVESTTACFICRALPGQPCHEVAFGQRIHSTRIARAGDPGAARAGL